MDAYDASFNHPMVKVKAKCSEVFSMCPPFQPPYGES